MLKDTDRYENTSHFTYSDYKRKVKKSPNKDLTIFVSVIASLIFFHATAALLF